MRDKNAVAALQKMHIAGSFHLVEPTAKSLLLPGTPFPREPVFGDVYGYDLAVLEMVETSKRAFAEDHLRMNRADDMYAALGMRGARAPRLGAPSLPNPCFLTREPQQLGTPWLFR